VDLQLVGCRLSWPHGQSDPHPSTLIAAASEALCYLRFRLRQVKREPGHSSLPKRAHPARQAHQPLGRGAASRPQAASTGAWQSANGRSRRRSPGGPSTLSIARPEFHPSGSGSVSAEFKNVFRERPRDSQVSGPSHACTESRARNTSRLDRRPAPESLPNTSFPRTQTP
jgi:hypothetical protein